MSIDVRGFGGPEGGESVEHGGAGAQGVRPALTGAARGQERVRPPRVDQLKGPGTRLAYTAHKHQAWLLGHHLPR